MSNETALEMIQKFLDSDEIDVLQYNSVLDRPLEQQIDFLSFRFRKAISAVLCIMRMMIEERQALEEKLREATSKSTPPGPR